MSRQKKVDALIDDEELDDRCDDYGEEEGAGRDPDAGEGEDEDEDEEGERRVSKKKIEELYKAVRKVVPLEFTKKQICTQLKQCKYDVTKTIATFTTLLSKAKPKPTPTVESNAGAKAAEAKSEAKKEVAKHSKTESKKETKKDSKSDKEPQEEEKKKAGPPFGTAAGKTGFVLAPLNMVYPAVEYKVDKALLEDKGNSINMVVIGHVDAGKSTLMGHLLYKLGYVSESQMHKYEKESKLEGKASFQYAWVLDENDTERSRGVTINIAVKHFTLGEKHVTLIDAPGHRDFIPNMISGAAQADCAILVIDSKKNAFDAGFMHGGQTKEHAILARCLGVTQLIIAINKLDLHAWDQGVFERISGVLGPFLQTVGYKEEAIRFVPISGLLGENLVERSKDERLTAWYTGPCLSELIATLKPHTRPVDRPMRACVSDCYISNFDKMKGTCVSAKVEGGVLEVGSRVALMPLEVLCNVRALLVQDQFAPFAKAGDSVEVALQPTEDLDLNLVKGGTVLSSTDMCIRPITSFKAQILTFELKTPITLGYQIVLHCYSLKIPAKITKMEKAVVEGVERKNPKVLQSNAHAVVVITTLDKVCLELFQNYKGLGRIAIRDAEGTIATGTIIELVK